MEPSKFLEKLSSTVDGKKQNWISSIIVFFLAAIASFAFIWISSRNSKELAKLKHERNKRKVEEENLKVVMHRELGEKKILELADKIKDNKSKITAINKKIAEAEETYEENLKNINSIMSWKDIQ